MTSVMELEEVNWLNVDFIWLLLILNQFYLAMTLKIEKIWDLASNIVVFCHQNPLKIKPIIFLKWVSRTVAEANNHTPKISHPYFHWYFYQNTSVISLYALGRIKRILDIIWPLNQHFKLKNQRNCLKQVWVLKFWSAINCFFMHWTKKLTLDFALGYNFLFKSCLTYCE